MATLAVAYPPRTSGAGPQQPARPGWTRLAYLGVLAVAFAARLSVVLTSGGLGGYFQFYDAGVYYAAADALTFGRLPYRNFTLLHPPGLMLVLTPFAMLGRAIGDHNGFMLAVVAFMLLGSVNAVLVVRVAREMGVGLGPATLGGLFYAVWLGSVWAEYQIRLEPLGNLLVLGGLLAHLAAGRTGRARYAVAAGAAFGAAAGVKIWWALPVVVLLGWHLVRARRSHLAPLAAGTVATLVVIDTPFFLAAPSAMWHMVVIDQLTRGVAGPPLLRRLGFVVGVGHLAPDASPRWLVVLSLTGLAAAAVTTVVAWRHRAARLAPVLLLTASGVLVAAPSWFDFYADYLTPFAALTVAAAAATARRGQRIVPGTVVAVATTVTVLFLVAGNSAVLPFPGSRLAAAASRTRCLMADEPASQILLDTLSRDLRRGCPNWIDVTGRTYGVDRTAGAHARPVARSDNPTWQRDLLDYLRSGTAAIVTRRAGTGLSNATMHAVRSGGILARAGDVVVYRTTRGAGR